MVDGRHHAVSAEILRITGASKVSEVSAAKLGDALRKLTSRGGPAFGAAAEQAQTLAGSISNAGIAVGNVQRSVGQALAPVINSVLLKAIPLFERLQAVIDGNRDAISGGLFAAIDRLRAIWDSLAAGFRTGFSSIRGVTAGSGDLAETFSRLAAVASKLFDTLGGWETVGKVVGFVVGSIANMLENMWVVATKVYDALDRIVPKLGAVIDKVAPIVGAGATLGRRILGLEGAQGGPIAASKADVGGRIRIELDDRRARVTATETTQPNLELDLAGGEAAAPA
ncbi:MAG: hypothetical protein H6748_15095 [Spirochaetaceae bacterium]|nr:hypothetical protein [Spirochaetaceae bacterium]